MSKKGKGTKKPTTLYHFTGIEYLPNIMAEGLTRGDVPLTPTSGINAVWLTTDPEPGTQEWASTAHELTVKERAAYEQVHGEPAPEGARYADKRAVRLTIELPPDVKALHHWPAYARLRGIKRAWYTQLNRIGGGGSDNWWIYRGTIPWDWVSGLAGLSPVAQALVSEMNRARGE